MKQTTLKVLEINQIAINKLGYQLSLENGKKTTQNEVIQFLLNYYKKGEEKKFIQLLKDGEFKWTTKKNKQKRILTK